MGSSMRISKLCARIVVLAAIALTTSVIANGRPDDAHWVGTWSASPQGVAAPIQLNGQTVRQIVHTSLGGERVRGGAEVRPPASVRQRESVRTPSLLTPRGADT